MWDVRGSGALHGDVDRLLGNDDIRDWKTTLTLKQKLTGHYMYHQFNIQQLYVLPTQCIYVFCVDLRTNSDYFPIRHLLHGFCNSH